MWGWFLVTFFAAIFTPKQKKNCFGTSTSARPLLLSNWQILLVLGKQGRPVGIVINSMNNLFRPKFEQHSWIIMNILSTWIESVLTGFPDMSFFLQTFANTQQKLYFHLKCLPWKARQRLFKWLLRYFGAGQRNSTQNLPHVWLIGQNQPHFSLNLIQRDFRFC